LNEKEKQPKYSSSAATMGYTIMAAVFFFTFVGYQIDKKFPNEAHIYTLLGIFAGFVYSGYEVWKLVKDLKNKDKKSK
jgi:hypothetical protein